jgi:adenine/guanine phosphoribosyltransferase-like PRPP-binding protein
MTDPPAPHPPAPKDFWQTLHPKTTFGPGPYSAAYPASFPDGRQLLLPIRPLPGTDTALASLIINQASFAVLDAIATTLAGLLRPLAPDIIVGLPTLGLTLAAAVAQRLGHTRYIPLGTSKKFWYDPALSVPLSSVTSPGQTKTLYLDPRLRPLLTGRVVLIDDVISSGVSIAAACRLLEICNVTPTVIGTAMLQTEAWRPRVNGQLVTVLKSPLLRKTSEGKWRD